MSERYPIPRGVTRVEDDVKKSRFIATIAHAPSADEARAFIQSIRDEFPDATHHCFAWVVGAPGSTRENGSGDDGEPGGTAGRPMLTALLASGVGDVAVVVTRYFGGIKLGRGGLVRAYSGAVVHACREMARAEHVPAVVLTVTVPYAAVDGARRALVAHGARIESEEFGADATFTAAVPEHRRDALESALRDATSGAAKLRVEGGGE